MAVMAELHRPELVPFTGYGRVMLIEKLQGVASDAFYAREAALYELAAAGRNGVTVAMLAKLQTRALAGVAS